ncbi:chorismate--pyruvate lyase family protein [Arsukibacterium sp.]|uniref:chorismate--pyruvate lyase family protein n=1 Tax=Arsukibacterium sp. TaxID=1977258 RepID=UPI002FD9ED72
MNNPVLSLQADWLPASELQADALVKSWLLEPASLTARLKSRCQQFRLQLLQQVAAPLPAFLSPLLPQAKQCQLREVLLFCDDSPCVYAQSWLPLQSLQQLQPLADLGEQPLGEYLFSHSELLRGQIEVSQLTLAAKPAWALSAGNYWARRSVLTIAGCSVLVAELFLPGAYQL